MLFGSIAQQLDSIEMLFNKLGNQTLFVWFVDVNGDAGPRLLISKDFSILVGIVKLELFSNIQLS